MVARAIFLTVLMLTWPASLRAATPFIAPDQDTRWTQSLNGDWKFKFGITEVDFILPDYDDSAWRTIPVPGNWELFGVDEPRYRTPGLEVGLYRRKFKPPQEWSGRRFFLRFEGVLWAFEFWLNGARGGSHEIPFCRSEFDVTDLIHVGAENTLSVRVYRRYKGWEFDTHDAWALSGIFRDVQILTVPDPFIADLTTTTTVDRDLARARVRLNASVRRVAAPGTLRGEVVGTLLDSDGNVVGGAAQPITLARNDEASVALEVEVLSPRLWNAENPELYEWRIALRLGDTPTFSTRQTVGIRQIGVENGTLTLNHRPIKIRGVNHHDIDPEVGRAMREEHYRRDVELMKAANINAVRFAHYPPHPVFLDLCDRYGLYAIDEVPFDGGDELLSDASYGDILLARVDATVQRDKNHPSVIVWSIGNENPVTPIVLAAVDRVRALDATRPKLLPGAGIAGGTYNIDLPPSVDILAPHYPVIDSGFQQKRWSFQEALKDPKVTRPILVTEFNNASGSAFEGLNARWETIMAHERLAGGCIWLFQDQGLRRKIANRRIRLRTEDRASADETTTDICIDVLYSLEDALDSRCGAGTDGIVYADRIPQTDYWITRKVFSPVVIPDTVIVARPGPQTLSIPITNRYDFTDLDRLRGEWRLVGEGRTLSQGHVALRLPPRQKGTFPLEVQVPTDLDKRDYVLRLAFADAADRPIYDRAIRLVPESRHVDFSGRLLGAATNKVDSHKRHDEEQITVGDLEVIVHPQTNLAIRMEPNGQRLSGPILRVGREPELAELRQYELTGLRYWNPPILDRTIVRRQEIDKSSEGGRRIQLQLDFPRPDDNAQSIRADVVCEVSPRSWLDVSYELTPTNAQDQFLEFGLGFVLPHTVSHLTWLGDGPYNAYPGQEQAAERGVYHISLLPDMEIAARFFAGNRTRVDLAAVTDLQGNGFGFVLDGATVSLDRRPQGMVFSQVLRAAGKGSKTDGIFTLFPLPASTIQTEKGAFRIVPLVADQWPTLFQEVLGETFAKPAWSGIVPGKN
jgi:beta-galactosidase